MMLTLPGAWELGRGGLEQGPPQIYKWKLRGGWIFDTLGGVKGDTLPQYPTTFFPRLIPGAGAACC